MKWFLIIALILITTVALARMDLTIQLGIEEVGGGGGPSADALLLETGDYLLLESGDYLLLE